MGIIHTLIRKTVHLWQKNEIRIYTDKFKHFGIRSRIGFPCTVSHPEHIEVGDEVVLLPGSRLQTFPEKVKNQNIKIIIGNHSMAGFRFTILAGADVIIGRDVIIASDVTITSENHGIDPESSVPYMDQELSASPVRIGDNTWIGDKVTILPGVEIGKGCIIGANSIVTKSIADYSIAVGNPAKVIKTYDFDRHKWVGGVSS